MPCPRGGRRRMMTPLHFLPKVITVAALVASIYLHSLQPARGQAYTLPGLSDLPALPGLASGLINSVTSGASWLAGVELARIAAGDACCEHLHSSSFLSWCHKSSPGQLWRTKSVGYYKCQNPSGQVGPRRAMSGNLEEMRWRKRLIFGDFLMP